MNTLTHARSEGGPSDMVMNDIVSDLMGDYVYYLDTNRYDDWLDLFAESAVYKIMPRDNLELGLPAPLMLCTNKNMIRDRITTLQGVNIYNIHTTRHIVGRPRLTAVEDTSIEFEASFAVYQTDQEGVTQLFGTGNYRSGLLRDDDKLFFESQVVQLDTFAVPTLLADLL